MYVRHVVNVMREYMHAISSASVGVCVMCICHARMVFSESVYACGIWCNVRIACNVGMSFV